MIRLLVSHGADPNVRGMSKARPLHSARFAPDPAATIELLISLGADPNAMDYYQMTPLHHAVKYGEVKAIRALLEGGADPDLPNGSGNSARDLAKMYEDDEMIDVIERYGGG